MQLNGSQFEALSKFFADIAKILVASAVVGFFIPGFSGEVNLPVFVSGSIFAAGFLILSIALLKTNEL